MIWPFLSWTLQDDSFFGFSLCPVVVVVVVVVVCEQPSGQQQGDWKLIFFLILKTHINLKKTESSNFFFRYFK